MNKTILFCILLIPALSSAQTQKYQLGGYIKYLYSNSDIPSIGRVSDHLIHSRVNSKFFLNDNFTAAAELRNRFFYGGSVEKIPGFLSSVKGNHDLGNADILWWNTASSIGYSELDRLWVDGTFDRIQVTAGRQRIAWGTSLVWNPSDLFNPLSILDFDYEERPGVDAVRLQYFSSEVSKIELAVKPGSTSSSSIIAGKILFNQWNYDFHMLGGVKGRSPFLGTAWAGDIAGGGFRGEIVSRKIDAETATLFPSLKNSWTTSISLSGDYTFTNNTYIHTEALYNDRGVTHNTAYAIPLSQSLGLLSPARWSLFQELSFDIHPLIRISGFVIYNPTDHSLAWVPSLAWSALENFDVSIFGLFFAGNSLSEYGSYQQSAFVRGKYSF